MSFADFSVFLATA